MKVNESRTVTDIPNVANIGSLPHTRPYLRNNTSKIKCTSWGDQTMLLVFRDNYLFKGKILLLAWAEIKSLRIFVFQTHSSSNGLIDV